MKIFNKKLLIIASVLLTIVVSLSLMRTENFRMMWQVSPPRRNSSYDVRGEVAYVPREDITLFNNASSADNYSNQRVIV